MSDKLLITKNLLYDIAKIPVIGDTIYVGTELTNYILKCKESGIINTIINAGYRPTMIYDFDETLYLNQKNINNPYIDSILSTIPICIDNNILVYIISYSSENRENDIQQHINKWINKNTSYDLYDIPIDDKIIVRAIGPASIIYYHIDEPKLWKITTGKKGAIRYKLMHNTNIFIIGNIGDSYRDFEPYTKGEIKDKNGYTNIELIQQDIISVYYNGKIFKIGYDTDIHEVDDIRDQINFLLKSLLLYRLSPRYNPQSYIYIINKELRENNEYIENNINDPYVDTMQIYYIIGINHTLKRELDRICLNNRYENCSEYTHHDSYDNLFSYDAEEYTNI